MNEVKYCEKCGDIGHVLIRRTCKNCGIKLKILPEAMKQKYNIFTNDWSELFGKTQMIGRLEDEIKVREEMISRENAFVMGELAGEPMFSLEEYKKQLEKRRKMDQELAEFHCKQSLENLNKNIKKMQKESDKLNHTPKCPICGSSNIRKITITKRAVKTATFGVLGAVDDAGKTWQCNNCGSKF